MLETVEESVFMIGPKFDEKPNYDTNDKRPKVVMRTHNSSQHFDDRRPMVSLRVVDLSSSHDDTLNVVTRGQYNVVLKVANDPKKASYSKQPNTSYHYDLMSYLQWTPTQISIFELLELSPLHKVFLEKSLCIANVPTDIDDKKFQDMVNHIS